LLNIQVLLTLHHVGTNYIPYVFAGDVKIALKALKTSAWNEKHEKRVKLPFWPNCKVSGNRFIHADLPAQRVGFGFVFCF